MAIVIAGIKNVTIVALVVSACYLAGQLWFERIASNRNFFYTVAEAVVSFGVRAQVSEPRLVEPLRIVKMFGNMAYRVEYDIRDSRALELSVTAVEAAMRHGRHTHSTYADWQHLLSGEGLMLEYALSMPVDILNGVWGISNGDVLNEVDVFNRIIVLPRLAAGEGLGIVFIDGRGVDETAHFFEVDDSPMGESVRTGIRQELSSMLGQASSILYSASSDTGIFLGNTFIPSFSADSLSYTPLHIASPYANHNGDILIGSLFTKLAPLFETPAAVSRRVTPGEFIFSDENTVVRFSQGNLMEFTNYRSSRYRHAVSISESLAIALDFIETDQQLHNRIYLSAILEEDGDFTFLFGHVAEGFPVIVPQALLESLQLRAPVEVTVRSGVVTNYRKWAVGFEPVGAAVQVATTGFWEAYDRVLEGQGLSLEEAAWLHRAALAFYANPYEPIGLVWQLHIGPARFIVRD